MVVDGIFVVCEWLGQLFERWWGLALRPLGMRLRPKAPFRVSFWVVFCGCSFELTNGGRQCWVSKAVRLMSANESRTRVSSEIT
jgi:hypothetical protein